ncbi:SMP-30/gluconolactonase/LRE family protein [Glaciibacter psychrotolerans]|uniref:Sugar lactone lactonase YvrE n=1 Tax=Glaciibacter psychrotolerans TaxID=670054 RepID=A0A7Z0EF51_9MICO|nr:sugar lactone lactonase YvrE [Leifsonia psychrotolerans]
MEAIIEGLAFPEGIRWRAGALYFSDVHSHQVLRWQGGRLEVLAHIPEKPSGLGFLNDDTLLVASQHDRAIYRIDLTKPGSAPVLHADLSAVASWHLNDMITDSRGRAYVGNYGSGALPGEALAPATLALVSTDGVVTPVADNLWFPNGMAFTSDERTLIVAETRSEPGRLTAFAVAEDGSLGERRELCVFDGEWPDGIAIDRNNDIWVASPFSDEVLRVNLAGQIVERVAVPAPYAVAVGGESGRDLFVASAETWVPEDAARLRSGRIFRLEHAVR